MDNTRDIIASFSKVLSLNGDNMQKVIIDSLEFISELNSDEIVKNSDEIANLFYLTLSKYNSVDIEDTINDWIKRAFENIVFIAEDTEAEASTSMLIIKFLKKINLMYGKDLDLDTIPNGMQNQFDDLCENLDNIKIVFKIIIDEKELFPIAKLLASVISKDFKFSTLDSKTLNTLLLALQVFNSTEYSTEKQKLQHLIDECNLMCLRYLENKRVKKFSDETWKLNFQKNGVLILCDIDQNKIYIRHEDRSYFNLLNSEEQRKLQDEKNSAGDRIASFYEYMYNPDFTFSSIDDLLLSKNEHLIDSTLKEIYNNCNFNVFYKHAFLRKDDSIALVNPFTSKDNSIVLGSKLHDSCVANRERVTIDCMDSFNLQIFRGKGLNNATIGLVAFLLSLENVDISTLTQDLNLDLPIQNQIIHNWILSTKNPINNLQIIYRYINEQLSYSQSNNEMANKNFEGLFLYPVEFSDITICELLKQSHVDFKNSSVIFEKLRVTLNKEDEPIVTKDDIALDIDKDQIPKELREYDQYISAVQDETGKWYFSLVIDILGKINLKVRELNKSLLNIGSLSLYTENKIQYVSEYMNLHCDALIGDKKVSFESIMKFRLIHNLLRYSITTSDKWSDFLDLLSKHQKIEFSNAFELDLKLDEQGTLFVPKERSDADTTLHSIYLKYYRSHSDRNPDIFYMNEVHLVGNEYYYRGVKIDRITFIFDTLQSGASTKRTLSFYFENYEKSSVDGVQNRSSKYFCNGQIIRIEEIIKANNPKICIYFMFGSEEGKLAIQEYINSHDILKGATIMCSQIITSYVDEELVELSTTIYKSCNMKIKQYPIIREFNQPKCNIFPPEMMKHDCIFALFVNKKELRQAPSQMRPLNC